MQTTSPITQKRAAIGGEIGANGEFYDGGKFIATKDNPKGQVKPPMARKMEIAPHKWEVQPCAGAMPLYRDDHMEIEGGKCVPFMAYWNRCFEKGMILCSIANPKTQGEIQSALDECRAKCDRFNAGERWI